MLYMFSSIQTPSPLPWHLHIGIQHIIYCIYRPSFGRRVGGVGPGGGRVWPADIFEIEATAHFCAFSQFLFLFVLCTGTAHFCNLYKYFIHYLFYTHIIFFVLSPSPSPSPLLSRILLFVYFFAFASFCALYKYCINFVFIARFAYSHLCIFDEIVFGFRSTNFAAFLCEISLEFMPNMRRKIYVPVRVHQAIDVFYSIKIYHHIWYSYIDVYIQLMMYSEKENEAICWHLISIPSASDLFSLAELLCISIHNYLIYNNKF